jgi:hypothetical protein
MSDLILSVLVLIASVQVSIVFGILMVELFSWLDDHLP